jgi:ADP-ribosylglycohydrolase
MISRKELAGATTKKNDKAYGAMIGVAIGDALGDVARTQDNHFMYGITTDFGSGPVSSTDDTDFALFTAKILIDTRGAVTDTAVLATWKKHVVTLDELKRGGASERDAALNIRRGLTAPETGMYNAYSMSDGAAMRATPIGVVFAGDATGAKRVAEIEARISHSAEGLWGAQAVAAAVAIAMVDGTVDEIYQAAVDAAPNTSWLHHNLLLADSIIRDSGGMLENAWMALHDSLRSEYKAAVPEAVTSAFAVFKLTKGEFRKGMIYASNFGRDADTIAAIFGGLAGALHGAKSIPPSWIEKCRYPTGTCLNIVKGMDIKKVSGQLANLIRAK